MDVSAVLLPLLTAGAALMASSAAGEFAKGAGKTAFEALKARLSTQHKVHSLALLDQASDSPNYAETIRQDLERAELSQDPELPPLIETLAEAIDAMPAAATELAAIDRTTIRAVRDANLKNIEGISGSIIEAGQDVNLEGVRSPGKH